MTVGLRSTGGSLLVVVQVEEIRSGDSWARRFFIDMPLLLPIKLVGIYRFSDSELVSKQNNLVVFPSFVREYLLPPAGLMLDDARCTSGVHKQAIDRSQKYKYT